MDVTEARVPNVAPCYHYASVRIGGMDDDLRSYIRKDVDLLSDTKWKPRKGPAGLSKISSSSILHERVASATLDRDSGNPPDDHPQNRKHKRIILSTCGKQLYLSKTRAGLLRGLIDGTTGMPIHS